jgi:NADPH:quinone reductase
MRAIQQTAFGGPEVLELADVPEPEPGPGQVLVRVTHAGLNFADTHQRENRYVQRADLPFVPGSEVAGVRADTGERVVALTGGRGGYAEAAVVDEAVCVPLPDGLDEGAALAMLVQGATAWHLLRTCARLAPGESVVVHGAAGGTGSLCVQLAKAFGAGRVIATASTEEKRALALELGADAATGPEPEGLTARLLEANGGAEVDVVLEQAGGAVFDASLEALAVFGRMVPYGIATKEQNSVRTGRLLKRSQTVTSLWLFHLVERRPELYREALEDCFARAARGELRVVVGATYPLEDARRAQEDLAARRTSGKLLLNVTSTAGPSSRGPQGETTP